MPSRRLPTNIRIEDRGETLIITRRWHWQISFFLFLVAMILIIVFFILFGSGVRDEELLAEELLVFGVTLAIGVAGFGLFYAAVACLFNRTVITVSPRELSVIHRPIPWPGNRRIPSSIITQIYGKMHARHDQGGERYSFHLHAITREEDWIEKVVLLRDVDAGHVQYLERTIEKHLGIQDRRVRWEMPK